MTSVRTGDTEVFEFNPATGDARNITRSPQSEDRYPCWSPHGKQIAFTSNRDAGTFNLFTCDADGSNVHQLTHETGTAVAYMPSWVGDRIAFGLHREKPEMASVNADGTDLKLLGEGHDPCFSPNGKRIAYTGQVEGGVTVFVMDADGDNKRRVVKDVNPRGAIFPSWSPDGKQLVYSFAVGEALELFIVDADGIDAKPRQVTHFNEICTPAAWSPDGKWISFRRTDEAYWRSPQRTEEIYAKKPGDKRPVWVIRPDGTDAHVVEAMHYQCAIDGSRAAWKPVTAAVGAADTRYFELRVYDVTPGKLDAVLARFRDSISKLYAAHGVEAAGYWTTKDAAGHDKFVYLVSSTDKATFDRSSAAFLADPAFKRAYAASEQANGKTVDRIESIPLSAVAWSPQAKSLPTKGKALELRVNQVAPGKMGAYLANYRDHRLRLFEKHGFANLGFWTGIDAAHQNAFVLLLSHDSPDAIAQAKAAYHADPEWKANVDDWTQGAGEVTTGVTSYVLQPTDFAPSR